MPGCKFTFSCHDIDGDRGTVSLSCFVGHCSTHQTATVDCRVPYDVHQGCCAPSVVCIQGRAWNLTWGGQSIISLCCVVKSSCYPNFIVKEVDAWFGFIAVESGHTGDHCKVVVNH